MRKTIKKPALIFAVILSMFSITAMWSSPVFSLSGSEFKADRIIDDAVFYKGDALTASQVQTFLNSKMPTCDTNGEKMYNSTQTRAEWAKANNKPLPPYTCLKDFKQSHGAKSDSGLCSPIPERTNRTAAQIIDEVSRACNISQKALIVMLQKEQSLVTDDWPWPVQYEKAMGYYCPDDPDRPGWCHPDYAGFFNQVYNAAKQFNRYKLYPEEFNHAVDRSSYVAYQANMSSCGGTNLTMQTAATAGLYNYTPYQPNAAALNNLYGTGDSCSAYGNRNFWRMFNDWFGSTLGAVEFTGPINISNNRLWTGDNATATFSIKNTTKYGVELDRLKVEAQNLTTGNTVHLASDSGVIIEAGKTYTYKKNFKLNEEGDYRFIVSRYDDDKWHKPPLGEYGNESYAERKVYVQHKPTVVSSLEFSKYNVHVNEPITAKYSIKNRSAYNLELGRTRAGVRDANGNVLDFPSSEYLTLAAGQTYNYSQTREFKSKGTLSAFIVTYRNNFGWQPNFPVNDNSTITRNLQVWVRDSVTVTSSLKLSKYNPHRGNPITASFDVTNHSTDSIELGRIRAGVRDAAGRVIDFPASPYLTLAPGETYSYSQTREFNTLGTFSSFIVTYRNNHGWQTNFPMNENSSITRNRDILSREMNVVLSEELKLSTKNPARAQEVTASFKLKNLEKQPVTIQRVVAAARDSLNRKVDFPADHDVTIPAGGTYTYNKTRTFHNYGNHKTWITTYRNNIGWSPSNGYPRSENPDYTRMIDFKVREPDVVLSEGLKLSTQDISVGQVVTATFTYKNNENHEVTIARIVAAVRNSSSTIVDFPHALDVTIPAGGIYKYSQSRTFNKAGDYRVWTTNFRDYVGWSPSNGFPKSLDANLIRFIEFKVK